MKFSSRLVIISLLIFNPVDILLTSFQTSSASVRVSVCLSVCVSVRLIYSHLIPDIIYMFARIQAIRAPQSLCGVAGCLGVSYELLGVDTTRSQFCHGSLQGS